MILDNGFIGFAPAEARKSDEIVVLRGGEVPFVVRRLKESSLWMRQEYELVGDCYVHGVMEGERAKTAGRSDVVRYHLM